METPACYSSHQPRQGGGALSPCCPDIEPGDEDQRPSRGQGLGAEVFFRPDPLSGLLGRGRAGGLDRAARHPPTPPPRPRSALPRPPPPAHKVPFTDSGSTSAAPEVWLTPLRKQTAPEPAGAVGHRGWILPLPAGGRTQTGVPATLGQGWASTAAPRRWARGAPGSPVHLGSLGQHPCFRALICARGSCV